ncbi:MAG: tetratricopeptide repeat protein [Desulfurivibrio sp.]|nr:tetratricopeptide repeat protein [Desulfurivibrio sp.]
MSFPFLPSQLEPHREPVTGLPDAVALAQYLEDSLAEGAGEGEERRRQPDFLVLLEIYPQARDAQRALAAIQRAGTYLHTLFGSSTPLFSLGLGVFALLWPQLPPEEARRLADVLLRRLQREKFSRAHIGLAAHDGRRPNGRPAVVPETAAAVMPAATEPQAVSRSLLTEAWQALAVARRRGPFCLCLAGSPPLFPPLAAGERAKLGRLWRGRERFALLLIRQDQPALSNHFSKRVRGALTAEVTDALFLNQQEVLVYLDQAEQQQALAWLADFRRRMGHSDGAGFSAGLALYPCLELPKAGIPGNCRKALLHAELLGPAATAVFNAVTLNISGDAYYNEGDIRKAVAEYRRGLELDPANVNLLNSLGVALAQLKQNRPAMAAFEQALAVAPDNFMALYNLGFALLAAGREDEALDCLEKARRADGHSFELALQLGRLYYRRGRYQEVVELLGGCLDELGEERRDGDLAAARRLLARGLIATGDHKGAETAIQQVLGGNSQDPEALSLLGELYLLNGEGVAIALSLCRQAVALDDENGGHWRRLGRVQWHQGELAAAAASLHRATKLDRRDRRAAAWLTEIYRQQGKNISVH